MKKKLTARRGFSLSEMLVTLLILALAGAAIAAGIQSSMKVYHRSTAISEMQTLSSTLSQGIMDELRYATNIHNASGTVVFDSQTAGPQVFFSLSGDERVQLGGQDLLSSGIYCNGRLGVKTLTISYAPSTHVFDVSLAVSDGVASRPAAFQVVALNPT